MGTLQEDIKVQSKWIIKAFKADGLSLNYTINSFKNLDHFLDLHSLNGKAKPDGRLSGGMLGPVIFSIGAYIGETLIKAYPGSSWITDDEDSEGEINAELKLANGSIIWPMQRVMKRFQNGAEDELFAYGFLIAKECGLNTSTPEKPWWKFW